MLEPRLDITRIVIPVPDLPAELDGFTIGHISDLHLGEGAWRPLHVRDAIDALKTEAPDIVVNTGDYMQGEPGLALLLERVAQFVLPDRPEVIGPRNIAILGNHDYFPGVDVAAHLARGLRALGITVLENEAVQIRCDSRVISIVGLTGEEGYAEFERGIETLLQTVRPRIALVHKPDMAQLLPPGSADFILSGHTHGGQIVLPGLRGWTVRRFCGSGYIAGLYEVHGMPLYVNRGLGCSGLPFRFRAAPEVTVIRLVR